MSDLRVDADGPVTVVTIDRPAVRNAVDLATATALAEAFRAFDADPRASVAVLTGAGESFCAGADLAALADGHGNRCVPVGEGDAPMGPTRLQLSKPVIAAVEGYAVAGGLELALWCDLRVAGAGAVFGVFCRRWGVPLIDGGTFRLPRLVGMGRALDLVLTGRAVPAEEALAIGLADRLVPAGTARAAAVSLAHEIADLPQQCLRVDRRSLFAGWAMAEPAALSREFEAARPLLTAAELRAGVEQFVRGAGRHGVPPAAGQTGGSAGG